MVLTIFGYSSSLVPQLQIDHQNHYEDHQHHQGTTDSPEEDNTRIYGNVFVPYRFRICTPLFTFLVQCLSVLMNTIHGNKVYYDGQRLVRVRILFGSNYDISKYI